MLRLLSNLTSKHPNVVLLLPLTDVQKQTAKAIFSGRDCIISAETGSGKTLAFVMPALSRLSYPPDVYMNDYQARL